MGAVSQWEREDALRGACNATNVAAASNATLIDADPEKKEEDNESDDAAGDAPAPLVSFAILHQAPLSQKEFSKPIWSSFHDSTDLMVRGITDQGGGGRGLVFYLW